jgi:hypothetical protein
MKILAAPTSSESSFHHDQSRENESDLGFVLLLEERGAVASSVFCIQQMPAGIIH